MSRIATEELRRIVVGATPGPWSYEYTRLGHTVRQPGNFFALMVVNHSENPEADGHLIALAPQLAAEVLELRHALQRLVDNLDEGDFISTTRIEEARAALSPAPIMDAVKQGDA